MKPKKHIDRLFSERFKDFEVSPPDSVWENLKAQLQAEKKKRRVIPLFWYKTAGVAALVLLFFSIGNMIFDFNDPDPTLTHEEIITPDSETPIFDPAKSVHKSNGEEIVFQDNTTRGIDTSIETEGNSNEKTSENLNISRGTTTTGTIAQQTQQIGVTDNLSTVKTAQTLQQKQTDGKQNTTLGAPIESHLAEVSTESSQGKQNSAEMEVEKSVESQPITVATTETDSVSETQESTEQKKSLIEYLAEKELEKEEEALAEVNQLEDRWSVSPGVMPLYYNTFGKGSPIDSQFADNTKKGDINLGYGVQVSYAVNDKWSVRTGLNKIDLSYVTQGIEFLSASSEYGLNTISYNSNQILAIGNQGTLGLVNESTLTDLYGNVIIPRNGAPLPGSIRQNIDYLEIPLEVKYHLLDSRFGVHVIGGLSTLVLNNNEISVFADSGFSSVVGKANNLNEFSFSTNIGIGLDYKLTRKILFNIEPMLKYQINAYTGDTNFKPYYLGVYSGFSYKF